MKDIWGFAASFAYVGGIFGILYFLKCSDFLKRKLLHFSMVQWWILRTYLFDKAYLAVLGPTGFIGVNYILTRRVQRFKSDEYGMVYYAVSLAILTGLSYLSARMYAIATVSLFVLGVCDPCAAVLGSRFGRRKILGTKKSYVGSTAFLVAALTVLAVVSKILGLTMPIGVLVLIACLATVTELFSRKGMDNLFIPLVVFLPCLLVFK